MAQTFSALNEADLEHLDRQREWVRGHFIEQAEENYQSKSEKLRLIQIILDAEWIDSNETWKLQSLGVAFGDALAQELDLAWMIVEDEYGRDPTLKDKYSALNINPITMISKRIERGEKVSVIDLFDGISSRVRDIRREQHAAGERLYPK